MPRYRFTITLTLRGPVLTKDSNPGGYGVDAPFFQRGGALFVPGTHVEGKLREAFAELAALDGSGITHGRIAALMGHRDEDGRYEPRRGLLHLGDFKCGRPNSNLRYRVKIDRETGAASERMLLLLEAPFASGEKVTATGSAIAWAADGQAAENIAAELRLGLRWVRQIGAARSIGFGALVGVKVEHEEIKETASSAPAAESLLLRITPHSPFFFGQHTPRENVLVSEATVPGAAIKGCLARAWEQRRGTEAKPAWFDAITITHAFPAARGSTTQRPVRAPLSLGWVKTKTSRHFYDLAGETAACTIDETAAAFRVDWKSPEFVIDRKCFGWADPGRELRVRTAIDSEKCRALDENLFSLELIRPDGCDWLARADFSAVAESERAAAREEFAALLGTGLFDFGKTKARAAVALSEWTPANARRVSDTAPRDGVWIVTLQTPAILADPRLVARDRRALQAAYDGALHEMSDRTLTLRHFYASQSLAGGKYLWRRFQPGQPYNPWLLTDPGSVFVLALAEKADADTAQKHIAEWLARGLPQPTWARTLYAADGKSGDHWSVNPFIRENGYGEIAVNLDTHTDWHPEKRGVAIERIAENVTQPFQTVPCEAAAKIPAPPETQSIPPGYQPDKLPERWIITAEFVTESPLHIGTGELKDIVFLRGKIDNADDEVRCSAIHRRAATQTEKNDYPKGDITETHYNAIARGHAEDPVIPGSSWKGPFRAAFERVFGETLAHDLFGPPDAQTGGRVEFCDAAFTRLDAGAEGNLPLWEPGEHTAIEASVALDRRTRTASEGKLYYTEYVPKGARFAVTLTAQGIGSDDARRLLWMLQNIGAHAQFGAEAGNGWGCLRAENCAVRHFDAAAFDEWKKNTAAGYEACIQVTQPQSIAALAPDAETPHGSVTAIDIALRFHSPLLVRRTEPPKKSGDEKTADSHPRLTPEGRALLPARSFRGALRSQCERILRTLLGDAAAPDPTRTPEALHDIEKVADLSPAAQLFGAAGWRATLDCPDFFSEETPALTDQEFVAIDRFTGGSAAGKKFKWQAAWPARADAPLVFKKATLRLDLDRLKTAHADQWAPGLLALALRDLAEGDISFGAGAGKGYGACTAEIEWLKTDEAAAHVAAFRAFIQKQQAAASVDATAAPV